MNSDLQSTMAPSGIGATHLAEARREHRLAGDSMGIADLVLTVLAALAPLTLMVAVTPLHFLKGGAAVPGIF